MGDLVVTEAGAVIDSVQVNGTLRVEAPNVIVRNSWIAGRPGLTSGQPLVYAGLANATGLRIENSEVSPFNSDWIVNGVFGFGFTVEGTDIHDVIDSVHVFGDNVTVRTSWLHDNYHGVDKNQSDGVTHDDSVQVQKGSRILLTGNTMTDAYNSALQITQDQGAVSDLTFSGNWASGGGCTLNIAEKAGGVIKDLTLTANRFGSSRFNCPIILSPGEKSIANVTNNVWDSTGVPVVLTCRQDGRVNWRC